jgi:hypothetical protein
VAKQLWHDGMSREEVLEHYGYGDTKEPHVAMGFWKKDSVPERIKSLPDGLLSAIDLNKKVQIIFEYDPDFPRAFLRIKGTKDVNVQ